MRLDELLTSEAILTEIGLRLQRYRLERNLTQDQLADLAGVGRATLQRLERGESVQTTSLIKLLRTLDLLGALDAAIPAAVDSPIAALEREQRQRTRQRSSGRRASSGPGRDGGTPWSWGDEEPGK
jgi:transcriptional regulator with XRE-family HTH domain